jgi:hypothetical protein
MFEYIGEKIRAALEGFEWVSRLAGQTEVLHTTDGGERKTFPGAKPRYAVTCEPGDYLNMAPDQRERCIVFVDFPGELVVKQRTFQFERVEIPFRVVVWYNDLAVGYSGNADKMGGMVAAIAAAVKGADYNTTGFSGCKASYTGLSTVPGKIWGQYGIGPEAGHFTLPYRTFAVYFTLKAHVSKCADYTIEPIESVC